MSVSSEIHSPFYHPHISSTSSRTTFNEDSPPGLTASGSSDDGSSPSSVAGGRAHSASSSSSSKAAGSSKPGLGGSSYHQAMSPWASTSDDSFAGSRRGLADDDMDFASFSSANDRSFSQASGAYLASPGMSASHNNFSMSASPAMTSSAFASPTNDEAKELRAASQRMSNVNGGHMAAPMKSYSNGTPWADEHINDEQMFDSIIDENSFG